MLERLNRKQNGDMGACLIWRQQLLRKRVHRAVMIVEKVYTFPTKRIGLPTADDKRELRAVLEYSRASFLYYA